MAPGPSSGPLVARDQKNDLAASATGDGTGVRRDHHAGDSSSFVTAQIDIEDWSQRAKALGGTSNVLFAALAARAGQVVGRLGEDGRAMLSFPVNMRTEGDTRGNAPSTITVMADPEKVSTDLTELRSEIKRELAGVDEWTRMMMTPLPLTPWCRSSRYGGWKRWCSRSASPSVARTSDSSSPRSTGPTGPTPSASRPAWSSPASPRWTSND